MHGPEHHALLPLALLLAYHNSGGALDLDYAIEEAFRRGGQVPGGICGYWGTCGAAVGTGIFMSIVLDAAPSKREGYDIVNRATSQSLARIARNPGPACCKRNSYESITEVVKFVKEELGVVMDLPETITCKYNRNNPGCLVHECPFFAAR